MKRRAGQSKRLHIPVVREDKVKVCRECPLYHQPLLPSRGPEDADVMVVGEAPHWMDVREGTHFTGQAGGIIADMLDKADLPQHELYIAGSVKCELPDSLRGKKAGPDVNKAITVCRQRLAVEIRRVQPKVIITLGDMALRSLTGKSGITARRGEPAEPHADFANTAMPAIIPTFHPNFIARQESMRHVVVQDLIRARNIATGGRVEARHPVVYHNCTKFGQAMILCSKLEKAREIAYDSETSGYSRKKQEVVFDGLNYLESKIFIMSFAFDMYEAWVLPWYKFQMHRLWTPSQRKILKARLITIFEDPTKLWIIQNAPFDLRFLSSWGVKVSKMQYADLLVEQALADENTKKDLNTIALMHTDLGNYKTRMAKKAQEARQ